MVACGPTRRGFGRASSAVGLLLFVSLGCREEPPFSIWKRLRALPEHEDAYFRKGFSDVFRRVSEPTLSCAGFEGEGYRFYWSGSFGGSGFIRVSISASRALGTIIVQNSIQPTKRTLSEEEQGALSMAIVRADFWQLSTRGRHSPYPDGSSWVIEGRRGGVYQVVHRWDPRSGPVRELGEHFRRLARLPPAE
jgi:hypothetical protein